MISLELDKMPKTDRRTVVEHWDYSWNPRERKTTSGTTGKTPTVVALRHVAALAGHLSLPSNGHKEARTYQARDFFDISATHGWNALWLFGKKQTARDLVKEQRMSGAQQTPHCLTWSPSEQQVSTWHHPRQQRIYSNKSELILLFLQRHSSGSSSGSDRKGEKTSFSGIICCLSSYRIIASRWSQSKNLTLTCSLRPSSFRQASFFPELRKSPFFLRSCLLFAWRRFSDDQMPAAPSPWQIRAPLFPFTAWFFKATPRSCLLAQNRQSLAQSLKWIPDRKTYVRQDRQKPTGVIHWSAHLHLIRVTSFCPIET